MKLAQIDFKNIQVPASGGKIDINSNPKLGTIIGNLLPYIFSIAGALFLLYFILGGFQFMIAAGDPKKAEAAKGRLTTALIGLLIVVFAYLIVQFFAYFLNIPDIQKTFSPE
jgi:ABC-type dipeptide/oligopeptide/nickel transport system permease component